LLVNGDLASILLFGGLLGWAVFQVIVINRAGTANGSALQTPASAMMPSPSVWGWSLYLVVAAIHTWLGYYPFPA
jgi:uncharacterized membrane protein